jgi:hypothetical protein
MRFLGGIVHCFATRDGGRDEANMFIRVTIRMYGRGGTGLPGIAPTGCEGSAHAGLRRGERGTRQ